MYTSRNYVFADSPEHAWELNQKKANTILSGGCWLRLGRRRYDTLIDLSKLGLNQIEQTDTYLELGAMVTLRQLETSPLLAQYFGSYFSDCTRHIVGVQFRNCATLGGSVAARFGFSDIVTALLPLNCQVHLVKAGWLPLTQYAAMPYDRDVLTHIRIPLQKHIQVVYQSTRNTQTDLPTLTCAASCCDGRISLALGARSSRPSLLHGNTQSDLLQEAEHLTYVENMRGSCAYRRHLAKILIQRVCTCLEGGQDT